MGFIPKYQHDGTGRDTYVNHAGSFWLNPLPGGVYFQSKKCITPQFPNPQSIDPLAAERAPHRVLFGQSRYGTTVHERKPGDNYEEEVEKQPLPDCPSLALEELPYDVPRPELRLRHPGHAQTGIDGTDGVTFNGVKDAWSEPRMLDATLLRIQPIYESTCHYGLRTGRFYVDDMAPEHNNVLPGMNATTNKYYS